MKNIKLIAVSCLAVSLSTAALIAQDKIHYTGTELSNPAYHDGQHSLSKKLN